MASHDLDDRDGFLLVDRGVEDDLADRGSDIFCSTSESRCMVGEDQIVVDRLRNSDEFHVTADLLRVAGELVDGIHGVVSADIEEVTDVHLTEIVKDRRIDFTLEVCRKLIAAGAEVCGRSQL